MFLRRTWDCSLKYGGCGAKYIYFQRCPASAAPFESLFGKAPAASGRERARGATRQRSIAWPIPLNQDCGEASFGGREILTFPPLCPLPLAKGGAFYLKPRFGCAARIPLWQGPRGERKGKGTRCDAAAEYSVANPKIKSNTLSLKTFSTLAQKKSDKQCTSLPKTIIFAL